MGSKKRKAPPRYVENTKLPASWLRLLSSGDFLRLSRLVEEEGKPRALPEEQYEALREVGRIDPVELGIGAFCMASILITFFVLR